MKFKCIRDGRAVTKGLTYDLIEHDEWYEIVKSDRGYGTAVIKKDKVDMYFEKVEEKKMNPCESCNNNNLSVENKLCAECLWNQHDNGIATEFEPLPNTIKISKWEELDGKENGKYKIAIYETERLIGISSINSTYMGEVSFKNAPKEAMIAWLALFGFQVEFTPQIKLSEKDWHYVRYLKAKYGNDFALIRRTELLGLDLLYGKNSTSLENTQQDLLFIGNEQWNISELMELEMEAEK